MNLKSICVYCGSSPGRIEAYADSARILAQALVEREIRLVYGGASVGIMGIVADAVLNAGGQVVGVIPDALVRREVAHKNLTKIHVTRSMHERKLLMAEMSDGFIALPGGIGTLEEIFEAWTWTQLGIHGKPCGLLNVEGYFDKLTSFLDHAAAEGFIKSSHRSLLFIETDPNVLLNNFSNYQSQNAERLGGLTEI
ncbi:MAG: TIGR00730 family Rossman fold protein [Pseudomonadota bacterium]